MIKPHLFLFSPIHYETSPINDKKADFQKKMHFYVTKNNHRIHTESFISQKGEWGLLLTLKHLHLTSIPVLGLGFAQE